MMMRCWVVSAALSLSIALGSCSGGGAGSPVPFSNSLSNSSLASSLGPSSSRSSQRSGASLVSVDASTTNPTVFGQIVALISGGFTILATSGCTSAGHLHIFVNSATTLSGPTAAVGLYAKVTGTGSCSSSITATSVATSASKTLLTQPSPIPLQTSKASYASTISGLFTGGFTLNPQGAIGHMHIYTNASTIYNGGAPKTGLYAQVTGTGSLTDFDGAYVTLYSKAPGSVTVSGTTVSATSYGFTLDVNATYPSVPVVMNGQTVVGGSSLVTGATVRVTGVGAEANSITAQQIVVSTPSPAPGTSPTPTPAPIAQKHLLTADYLGSPNGTTSIAWSAAAPYLTWAQTGWQSSTAISAAGIKTQYYADPNLTMANDGDQLYTANESTFAHDCSGNRVTTTYEGSQVEYVMEIGGTSMQSLFANLVTNVTGLGHFDAVYEDDAGPLSETGNTYSAMPCSYTDPTWITGGIGLNQAPSIPIIFNGLSALDGQSPSLSIGLLASGNTIGGNYEHCYSDVQTPKMGAWVWTATENTELQVAAKGKFFECQLRDSAAASSSTDARLYALASFLLTYSPSTSILWEEFATTTGLHVEPESQLVLLNPTVATPASVSALQQTGGTYGRQYGQCYIAGQFVGSCAVVVNPDTQLAHPFPYPQYSHTLVLSGGGILDGGTVATNGPAPPLNLAPTEAAIAFP